MLLGLLLAGLLHIFVPAKVVLWVLGKKGWVGAIRGAIAGMPLPLCSCGVVPTALTLRRQGASLSAIIAFTIATPETSIDALAITAALLPSAFLGIRPLAALVLAIVVGVIVELLSGVRNRLRDSVQPFSNIGAATCDVSCQAEICRVCGLLTEEEHVHGFFSRLLAAVRYASGSFFAEIATWLIFGLVVAALLEAALPADAFQAAWFGRHPGIQIIIAILMGVPLYACATATTPLAAVLLSKGVDPGAALALLLAGPATNIGNFFALKRALGTRITTVYYGALLGLCWLFGFALHHAWRVIARSPSLTAIGNFAEWNSWVAHIPRGVEISTAWILILLTVRAWGISLRMRARGVAHDPIHEHEHNTGQH